MKYLVWSFEPYEGYSVEKEFETLVEAKAYVASVIEKTKDRAFGRRYLDDFMVTSDDLLRE